MFASGAPLNKPTQEPRQTLSLIDGDLKGNEGLFRSPMDPLTNTSTSRVRQSGPITTQSGSKADMAFQADLMISGLFACGPPKPK